MSFRSPTCSGLISLEIRLEITFKLAPFDSKKAAAVKSFSVVLGKVKEPVSSYMPRHKIVASSGEISISFSLKISVRIVTVAPVAQ